MIGFCQVEVKKAEPRDLRLVADCATTTAAAFIVAPSFLARPLAGSVALPNAGLLAGTAPWCSPNGSGAFSNSRVVLVSE